MPPTNSHSSNSGKCMRKPTKLHQTVEHAFVDEIVLFDYTIPISKAFRKCNALARILSRRRSARERATFQASALVSRTEPTTDWIRTCIPFEFCSIGFDWWLFCIVLCLPQENWLWIFIFQYFSLEWSSVLTAYTCVYCRNIYV